ncbi:AAA family ATPase [Pleomorphomonas sp. JP5]|uniref:AAA family ATPase n=1 Tax=Pleomorphomonas sp. JP5 TaxID=2942998 RepID=UPI002044C8CB|nr:ATP-binding protein [Pleomorphomonas sp. JP5]MCM5557416.1 AAA family ATPase [Pleomorphomonas sp. JP5]
MINEIRLKNFKSFADGALRVGPFTVMVGTNASGKSNMRDAFRFLHGIGRGYTLAEIIGGKYGSGGQVEWGALRGSAREIVRFGKEKFSLEVTFSYTSTSRYTYHITVMEDQNVRSGFRVIKELLAPSYSDWLGECIYTSHPGVGDPINNQEDEKKLLLRMSKTGDQRRLGARLEARSDQPALTQIADSKRISRYQRDRIEFAVQLFSSMRFLDLVPDAMRKPAFPGQTVLGDSGENLSTVLQDICSDSTKKGTIIEWIRELTPMDIKDLAFVPDGITGLVQLAIVEYSGQIVSSYSVSDGTLRFLAMLAALFGSKPAMVYFFEEIDNGIHPSRLRVLLDMIETQTKKRGTQVITTTHSPDLLSMISDETFENTSVVARASGGAFSIIKPVKTLPKAIELRKDQGLGRLHASGWMEDIVSFTIEHNQEER